MQEETNIIDRLKQFIEENYHDRREFIEDFNRHGGQLDETVLSRQLNGSRNLSSFAVAAYSFFMQLKGSERRQ